MVIKLTNNALAILQHHGIYTTSAATKVLRLLGLQKFYACVHVVPRNFEFIVCVVIYR